MPDAINIVFYPLVPTDGGDFQQRFLTGLSISAYEVDEPHPVPAAADQPAGNLIGTATYNPAVLSTGSSAILQHSVQPGLPPPFAAAVASAIIFLPGPVDSGQPYVNVVLKLDRSGTAIADQSINYDTPVISPGTPIGGVDLETFPSSGVLVPCFDLAAMAPSLYVGLAPPAGALASVNLPADGSPPAFADLQNAVSEVLAVDPAIIDPSAPTPDLSALTPQQCTHIAREILWQRSTVNPVPQSVVVTHDNVGLEQLYTAQPGSSSSWSGDDSDREEFQGALQSYYATLDASTNRLGQYIFALSAAIACSQQASAATTAEIVFPVRTATTPSATQLAEATIKLQG